MTADNFKKPLKIMVYIYIHMVYIWYIYGIYGIYIMVYIYIHIYIYGWKVFKSEKGKK